MIPFFIGNLGRSEQIAGLGKEDTASRLGQLLGRRMGLAFSPLPLKHMPPFIRPLYLPLDYRLNTLQAARDVELPRGCFTRQIAREMFHLFLRRKAAAVQIIISKVIGGVTQGPCTPTSATVLNSALTRGSKMFHLNGATYAARGPKKIESEKQMIFIIIRGEPWHGCEWEIIFIFCRAAPKCLVV